MEIKRMLCKKVIFTGMFLFVLQAAFFVTTAMLNRAYSEDFYIEKAEYVDSYAGRISKIIEKAAGLEEFSIFQKAGGFAYNNRKKTVEDFSRVADLSLSFDRDNATRQVLSYRYLAWFTYVFAIYIIYELLRERDNGMWQITHSMAKGRGTLAFRRVIGLVVITTAFYLFMYAFDIMVSCIINGMDDFGGPIQTIQDYALYTYPLSKGSYLFTAGLKQAMSCSVLSVLSYMVFTVLKSRNFSVVLLILTGFSEWQLAEKISVYSNLKICKYINIMQFFDVCSFDREYKNLDILGHAVSASLVFVIAGALLFVVSAGVAFFVYERQYPGRQTKFDILLYKVKRTLRIFGERLSFSFMEAYKILICEKGLLLLVSGALVTLWIAEKTIVEFPDVQREMDAIYEEYGGADWNSFERYIAKLQNEYDECIAMAENLTIQMRSGEADSNVIFEIGNYEKRASGIQIFLKEFSEKKEQYENVYANTGIAIFALSDRGYNEAIGKNGLLREIIISIILVTISVLLSSAVFGFETRSGIIPLLRPSGRGVSYIWKRKTLCICITITLSFLIIYGINFIILLKNYNFFYLSAPVQSLSEYAECRWNLSIIVLWFIQIANKLLLMLSCSAISLYISANVKRKNRMYVPILIVCASVLYICMVVLDLPGLYLCSLIMMLVITCFFLYRVKNRWCEVR